MIAYNIFSGEVRQFLSNEDRDAFVKSESRIVAKAKNAERRWCPANTINEAISLRQRDTAEYRRAVEANNINNFY